MRFNQLKPEDNEICFYCEGKNYWPHLQPIVEALLLRGDVVINYVTSDDNDPALAISQPNFKSYVIGDGYIRNYFFENLNSQLVVMTMPDLDQYQVKKSAQVKQFIYVHHSLVSHHMVYRPKAFDAFDVIMCAGPHHNAEIAALVQDCQMPAKKMINHGYGRLDSIMANSKPRQQSASKTILVAPSWGANGTLELMGEELIDALMALPHHVILRPHPQSLKYAKAKIDAICTKYQSHERFSFEFGVSSEASLHRSDLMISDWSGAALEYAFGLLKPVLFIDVPKKVQNQAYQDCAVEPFEISIREQIGLVQDVELTNLADNVHALLNSEEDWQTRLVALRQQHVYHLGRSGQVAANAIMELL